MIRAKDISKSINNIKPLTTPYIPEGRVSLVVLDERTDQRIVEKIESMGIKVLLNPAHPHLNPAVASHPDMVIHHLGRQEIVTAPGISGALSYNLKELGFETIEGKSQLESHYPSNIAYNIARIDYIAFHHAKNTDKAVLTEFGKRGVRLVGVRQGYAKCSIAIVNKDAIITSDRGIAAAAWKEGLDVLIIQPGHIQLPGFDYGFFGGCTGLVSPDKMAITGDLDLHPDCEAIRSFLEKHRVEMISLAKGMQPVDVGSILPLAEYVE